MLAFFELFEAVISFAGNSLSFVRLGAFAVAHEGLSQVVLLIAGLSGSLGWLVILIGTIFIVAFEGLIVGHPDACAWSTTSSSGDSSGAMGACSSRCACPRPGRHDEGREGMKGKPVRLAKAIVRGLIAANGVVALVALGVALLLALGLVQPVDGRAARAN